MLFYKRWHLTQRRGNCLHWLTHLFTEKKSLSRCFLLRNMGKICSLSLWWKHFNLLVCKIIVTFPVSCFVFVLKCTLWLASVNYIHPAFCIPDNLLSPDDVHFKQKPGPTIMKLTGINVENHGSKEILMWSCSGKTDLCSWLMVLH